MCNDLLVTEILLLKMQFFRSDDNHRTKIIMSSAGMINLENKLQSPFISELEAAKSLL